MQPQTRGFLDGQGPAVQGRIYSGAFITYSIFLVALSRLNPEYYK
jgi:hypothetical protein